MAGSDACGYEDALLLAENGQYQQSIACIERYLAGNPCDAQAWNDAATILFCAGRTAMAIGYFEKALEFSSAAQKAQICWNLTEVYLTAGIPDKAVRLYHILDDNQLLTCDMLNRTANLFLENGCIGMAVKMLCRSCRMVPQALLEPMIEVIRSKRQRIAIFASGQDRGLQRLHKYLNRRYPVELYTGQDTGRIRDIMSYSDIAWFQGEAAMWRPLEPVAGCKVIVRLDEQSAFCAGMRNIAWGDVSLVLADGCFDTKETLIEFLPEIAGAGRIEILPFGVDTEEFSPVQKSRGRKIAAVCDFSAAGNMVFLLHCLQKLHYIDNRYTLHIAGRFCDRSLERYAAHIIDVFGLGATVYFDGRVDDLAGWLADKDYIVTAGINRCGFGNVLKGMACGLKPLVHNFPGSEGLINREFIFDLSEHFCSKVLSDDYRPERFRDIACTRYHQERVFERIDEILIELEQAGGTADKCRQEPAISYPQMIAAPQTSDMETCGQKKIMRIRNIDALIYCRNNGGQMPALTDFGPVNSACQSDTQGQPVSMERQPADAPPSYRRIDQLAVEALQVARTLRDMAKKAADNRSDDLPEAQGFEREDDAAADGVELSYAATGCKEADMKHCIPARHRVWKNGRTGIEGKKGV